MVCDNLSEARFRGRFRCAALAAGLAVAAMAVAVIVDRGVFWVDDFQSQYLPAYVDIARAVRAGEVPLFSPWSWFGGNLAGEYQYGIFSAFLLPVVVLVCGSGLPLWAMAALLGAVHVGVTAAGCTLLFRRSGAPAKVAVGLAMGTALGGHLMTTGACSWIPGVAAFAWIPWLWLALDWALEHPARMARSIVAGVPFYLILSAGWPFAAAAAGVLFVWFAARAILQHRSHRALLALACACVVGIALAAPALVALVSYVPGTTRAVEALDWSMITPPTALLGFWNPAVLASWRALSGVVRLEPCPDLYAGLFVAGAVPAVLARGGRVLARALRWELALAAITIALLSLPTIKPFRWSFRWAPFLILVAGVIASRGWLATPPAVPRCSWPLRALRAADPLRASAMAAAAGTAVALLVNVAALHRPDGHAMPLLSLSILPALWLLVDRLSARERVRWSAALAFGFASLCVTTLGLGLSHWYMRWPSQAFDPPKVRLPHDRTILSLHDHQVLYTQALAPVDRSLLPIGNSGMLWQVPFVNGYSALGPRGLTSAFLMEWSGFVNRPPLEVMQHLRGLLGRMGVDYIVVPSDLPLGEADREWHEAAGGERLKLLERNRISPPVRAVRRALLTPRWFAGLSIGPEDAPVPVERPGEVRPVEVSGAEVEVLRTSRLETVVKVTPERKDAPVLLVFAQPYYPGMRAWSAGRKLKVWQADGMMPAVPLPPGGGCVVVLSRLSRPVLLSAAFAGCMALVVAAALFSLGRQRWRMGRGAPPARTSSP